MKVNRLALLAGGAAIVWLVVGQSSRLKSDLFRAGERVSDATGGRIPTPSRDLLPDADPQFGVDYDLPSWWSDPITAGGGGGGDATADGSGDGVMWTGGSPNFDETTGEYTTPTFGVG